MFDPTIYENVKVVLEGELYDRDLDGEITISNRSDLVDLATLSRTYVVTFEENEKVISTINLHASLESFSAEQLQLEDIEPGCELKLSFEMAVRDKGICDEIYKLIKKIWGDRPYVSQTLSYKYRQESTIMNKIDLEFNRQINEDQISDLTTIVDYTIRTANELAELK
ncbi:hypothetical protein [Guptibacillus algicola]|uniref:hypothetical protein n=1 Tax=Guptibacillus algicola TaxID=225844 RepID=UPI001CD21282|nr:hypothetical protein [Alkalihalobacillus algicola]MCA0985735.1 hypothetical protein [Alkalihalobacillus algicola]